MIKLISPTLVCGKFWKCFDRYGHLDVFVAGDLEVALVYFSEGTLPQRPTKVFNGTRSWSFRTSWFVSGFSIL